MADGRRTADEKSRVMAKLRTLFIAGVIAAGFISAPALADPPRDSQRAFQGRQHGRSMPLPELERRVTPLMGGAEPLGPELNGGTYRMKYIQNGRVIWVDVDPQTGKIIRRSRP
jgi:hypothetical protein